MSATKDRWLAINVQIPYSDFETWTRDDQYYFARCLLRAMGTSKVAHVVVTDDDGRTIGSMTP